MILSGNSQIINRMNKKTLYLFNFPEDQSGGRMGSPAAYMIGLSTTGEAYMCFAQTQPGRDPVFERRQWMDKGIIVARLLDGRKPEDIPRGSTVDAGMGNWGEAIGPMDVLTDD